MGVACETPSIVLIHALPKPYLGTYADASQNSYGWSIVTRNQRQEG